MKTPRKPLTVKEFYDAIKLCQREEGATGWELCQVLHFAPCDVATVMKRHLKKYRPDLKWVAKRGVNKEPNRRILRGTKKTSFTFRIINA